jgi:hypothetical protein
VVEKRPVRIAPSDLETAGLWDDLDAQRADLVLLLSLIEDAGVWRRRCAESHRI